MNTNRSNRKLRHSLRTLLGLSVFALMAAICGSASAQYFPTFYYGYPNTMPGSSGVPQGVSVATVPASSQPTELLAVFNDGNTPRMANSIDGVTYASSGTLPAAMYCDAVQHANHCTPAIANYNGTAYVAFRDFADQLEIWSATLIPGYNTYGNWTLAQTIIAPGGGMNTSPQMVVFQGKLFIIYGVKNLSGITNALAETWFDGTTWQQTTAGLGSMTYAAPTQVGLAEFNGTLYMVTQQNNSQRHLLYWSSPDGFNWSVTLVNSLYVDSGLSMVSYNNNLVFTSKQNNNQDHVMIFSSPNGYSWYVNLTSPLMHQETTAAITLFNGGIQMIYLDHSGNGNFYSAFGY